jgi:transcriptional regulator with XRE-family HTH domain
VDAFDLSGVVRRVRRTADLSQRELAERIGVPQSTLAAAETGGGGLPVAVLARIAQVVGGRLAVLTADGTEVTPMDAVAVRDRAGRRFPAHLDTRYGDQDWWKDSPYRRGHPRYTFDRQRRSRDWRREPTGIPPEHLRPGPDDSPAARRAARSAAARAAADAARQRRFLAGELPRSAPEPACTCPAACDELLAAGVRHPHVADCPCGCDVG